MYVQYLYLHYRDLTHMMHSAARSVTRVPRWNLLGIDALLCNSVWKESTSSHAELTD